MEVLRIKNFLGINKKADPADIETHECQTLDGFDTFKVPGALTKRSGYTDQADGTNLPSSYPSNWTIKNFYRFKVNKPSAKVITIVHATVTGDSSERVYADWTYNGTAWVHAWVELTENEESLTAGASTGTDAVVCTSLASSANDYYNNWYLFNWTRKTGALISDYTGASKTIALKTTITSQAVSDIFSIYRFPLITQFEGYDGTTYYTADTNSTTDEVIDAESWDTDAASDHFELRSDFDDAYGSWVICNTDATCSTLTSDDCYEAEYAGDHRKLSLGTGIATLGKGESYYIYKPARVVIVDNTIKFRQRPNVCIMACGNASRYPKQFPLWYGHIRSNYYFGASGNSVNEGYYLEPATLDAPDDNIISDVTAETSGSDFLDAATYYFACAYVYDGYQVGPLTTSQRAQDMATAANGSQWLNVELTIGYSALPNMAHSRTLNKRVTAIDFYASDDFDIATGGGSWYRIIRIPIRQDYSIGFAGTSFATRTEMRELPPLNVARQSVSGISQSERAVILTEGRQRQIITVEELSISWSGTDPYTTTLTLNGTSWTNRGYFYSLATGGVGGHKINYAVGVETGYHSVVGKVFYVDKLDSVMSFSPIKPDGTPSLDYFPLINVFDLAQYGIYKINDIQIDRNYIYIVGDTKTLRFVMTSGSVPSFRLDSEYNYVGSESEHASLKINDGIFVVSRNGCFFLANNKQLISLPIEDISSYPIGVSDLSEAYVGFNAETNSILIAFPTDTKIYEYNTISQGWAIHSVGDAIKALCTGEDGELYGADGSKIYRLNYGEDDDGTNIAPEWKSKVYNMDAPDVEKVISEIELTYKSDTAWEFDIYIDHSTTEFSWNTTADNQPAASTSILTKRIAVPESARGKEFEFGITIPSALRATNTYLYIYEIDIHYRVESRID